MRTSRKLYAYMQARTGKKYTKYDAYNHIVCALAIGEVYIVERDI